MIGDFVWSELRKKIRDLSWWFFFFFYSCCGPVVVVMVVVVVVVVVVVGDVNVFWVVGYIILL